MKKVLTILAGLFLTVAMQAQESGYADQAKWQHTVMNDGLYDMIRNGNRNWNINVPVSGNARPQTGMQIHSGSTGEAYTVSHKPAKGGGRKHYTSPTEANNRIAAIRDRQLAAARAKQEAIKQRKRAEDDRSEMRARMQHAMATAPYYAEAYARDHWNATEGYRILASVKASDIARRPQRKATSGADLAAGIKPKKGGGITFVSDDMLKTNKAFSATGDAIDVAGNGVIDEQQVRSWMDSFEQPGLLIGKKMSGSKKVVGGTPIVLVSHDELALEEMSIFPLPQYGLVGMLDDSLMVLKDAGLGTVGWTNRDHYSYVVPCGSRLIGRKDRSLYVVHDQASEKLLELNTNEFSIFPHDDQSVFVLSWHEGLSTILKVDVTTRAYSEMARLPYGVWTIASNGKEVFALVDNAVFVVSEKGFPAKMYASDAEIHDMTFSAAGLLIATDEQVLYVQSKDDVGVFYAKGAKRLWHDAQGVYALDMNNDLLYFENLNK